MRPNLDIDEALADARTRFAAKRPKSREAHDAARRHMPGGNTRTVLYHGPFPLCIAEGEAAHVTDVDGCRYLNMLGEYTAGVFGHSHPAIRKAVARAMQKGVNLSAHNPFEGRLAELICARFPAIDLVRFTNSGTEANLMAVSTARYFTGRDRILVFDGGYHGGLLYFGGGGIPINAPFPYVLGTYNDIDATRTLIRENADDLACVLVEAMLGSGGCIPGTADFLTMLREETAAAGALVILDEVMTSRFDRHGAQAMPGVSPDLATLGKWVGGGMSFGAFGGRSEIMAAYDPGAPGALPHAGTFNNNVLSMNAGIAALTEAFPPDAAEALHKTGENLRDRVNAVFAGAGVAMCASGVGSLMNLHGVAGPVSRLADLRNGDDRAKELLFLDLLDRGIYVARRGFIALSTAVTDDDLDAFIATLKEIVSLRRSVLPRRD